MIFEGEFAVLIRVVGIVYFLNLFCLYSSQRLKYKLLSTCFNNKSGNKVALIK